MCVFIWGMHRAVHRARHYSNQTVDLSYANPETVREYQVYITMTPCPITTSTSSRTPQATTARHARPSLAAKPPPALDRWQLFWVTPQLSHKNKERYRSRCSNEWPLLPRYRRQMLKSGLAWPRPLRGRPLAGEENWLK